MQNGYNLPVNFEMFWVPVFVEKALRWSKTLPRTLFLLTSGKVRQLQKLLAWRSEVGWRSKESRRRSSWRRWTSSEVFGHFFRHFEIFFRYVLSILCQTLRFGLFDVFEIINWSFWLKVEETPNSGQGCCEFNLKAGKFPTVAMLLLVSGGCWNNVIIVFTSAMFPILKSATRKTFNAAYVFCFSWVARAKTSLVVQEKDN